MGNTKRTIEEEVNERYESAFEILACRCLGEPYNFYRIAPMLLPGTLKSSLQAAKIVAACGEFFAKNDSYSPQAIALHIGIEPSYALEMSMRDSEMSLPEAMESFMLYYGQWVEMRIADYSKSWIMKGMSSEEMQVEQMKARKDYGLQTRLSTNDGKEEFEKILLAAIDGIQQSYPVSPYLSAQRKLIPFYEPGDYIVVQALSGVGKSYEANNQILHNSLLGVPSCLINLENTPKNNQKRIWQMHSKCPFKADMRGTDAQMQHYLNAWEDVKKMPFKSFNPGTDLNSVLSTIRQDWNDRGIQFAAIDYGQLMNIPGYRGGRNYELGEISRALRSLALELQIPIMALAQTKQEVDKTATKRPGMYDVKDCSNFTQDATIVKALYRPSYHQIEVDEKGVPYPENYADHFIAKGREVGIALIECRYNWIEGFHDVPELTQFPIDPNEQSRIIEAARPSGKEDIPF